jgi:hypothetical protein
MYIVVFEHEIEENRKDINSLLPLSLAVDEDKT